MKDSFGDYLVANGFKEGTESGYFFKDNIGVMICGDSVDVGDFTHRSGCKIQYSFTGISKLDDFGWIWLMHIMGAVRLSEFFMRAASANSQAKEFISNISRVFNPYTNEVVEVQ